MINFEFATVSKILFGRGKIAQLGEIARTLGTSVLMIHNGDDPGTGGPVDRAVTSLNAANIKVHFKRQRGEPTIADVDTALAVARENQCDLLIGLGGGSAIDTAKATAGLMTNGGQCLDYMEVIGKGRKISKPAMPWIAVPTTAGTGAEVTKNAVIGSPAHKFKASIRSEHLLARVAMVDAELHVGTPPEVTAASGMDAICQLIESLTSTGATPVTDALVEAGVGRAMYNLRDAFVNGNDIDAREEMALAATLRGITLTNAGLGAVHGFAAPLGAHFPIPHGVICARLLPLIVEANILALHQVSRSHAVLAKYADMDLWIPWSKELSGKCILVSYLNNLVTQLRIPPLSEFGLREEHVSQIVLLARKTSSMKYNPVVLADDVLANILRSAL